jgi:hypothetical protein
MATRLSKLLTSLLCLLLLLAGSIFNLSAADFEPEEWQKNFFAELRKLQQSGESPQHLEFSNYASGLKNRSPQQLLKIVDERVSLRPYIGSMVDPAAALMGGIVNSLDRARLLSALLDNAGYKNRIVFVTGQGAPVYPEKTPAPIQPIDPERLQHLERQVQSMAAPIWERICTEMDGCADWMASLNNKQIENTVYWVQVNEEEHWINLVPGDTQITETALAQVKNLSGEALAELRWTIGFQVTTSYSGSSQPTESLAVEFPAAKLHGKPLTYYNIPNTRLDGFMPTLAVAGLPIAQGEEFPLVKQGARVTHQQLHIQVQGPNEARHYVRKLATPTAEANGLEMSTRGRITVATGPHWEENVDELVWSNLIRLGNLLYAEPAEKDPRPLNFASIRAISFLALSRRLSGQLGTVARQLLSYQGRPAIIFQREYPERINGAIQLLSDFDIVDPGHAISCANCLPEEPLKAAVEQSVLDGALEDWIVGSEQSLSSHWLVKDLLDSGISLAKHRPEPALWSDSYASGGAVYRLGTVTGELTGWRLDPGPQVLPILAEGQGGVRGEVVAASASSSVLRNIYKHITSKCGASDIGGSILLAMAGAPMTGPLLSGIVGHMCRVAEAYNKAATVMNCLEFMGNDCSAQDAAKELEKILKGLGDALAKDLAIAQAFDIGVGAAIHGFVSPVLKEIFEGWGKHAGKEAAESAAEGASKEAAESAAEGASKEAAESAAEGASREAAESAAQGASKEAAESAAEGAGKESGEGVAKGAGGVEKSNPPSLKELIKTASEQSPEKNMMDAIRDGEGYVSIRDVPHYRGGGEIGDKVEIGRVVEDYYARNNLGPVPPTHTTSSKKMPEILDDQVLEGTTNGSPSWSDGGILRDGDTVIRLSEEGENFVRLTPATGEWKGSGQVPKYFRDGFDANGVPIGTPTNDIPAQYLEYYNYKSDTWIPMGRD